MKNKLTYPFKVLRLSQSYNAGNHVVHNTGSPKDYPIDEAGVDSGKSVFYCPCDEMKIVKLYGDQDVGCHVWLESTSEVTLANGETTYITILAVHIDESEYKQLKVGATYKRGIKIFHEGNSGRSSGNHIHFCVGRGRSSISGDYWTKNSKQAWVLTTPGGPLKPEAAFFIDPGFTTIKNAKEINFKKLEEDDMSRGYFQKGDRNEGVLALKQSLIQLRELGVINKAMDDNEVFGNGTETAVKQVQKAAGLVQDGKAGPLTIRACHTLIAKAVQKKDAALKAAKKKITNAQNALK